MTQTYNQVYVLSFQSHKICYISQIQILLTNLDNFSSKQMVRIEVYDREGVTLIFKGDG